MTIATAYGAFLDTHEPCEARHHIRGSVPKDGTLARVTFTCGCGRSHIWEGAPAEARRLLDVYADRCRREPWPTTH